MQPVLRVLQALALLAGIWGLLILVGWLADAFPPSSGPEPEPEPEDAGAPAPADAGVEPAPSPPVVDAGAPDTGPPEPTGPPRPTRELDRFTVCDPAASEPSLAVDQMAGPPLPELAVGCGALVQILSATTEGEGALAPVRVIAFEAAAEEAGVVVHAAAPLAADVDGDSATDLVLGFAHRSKKGGARGGALYLLRANATGSFQPPERLASIAAVATAAAPLDAKVGADVAALHQANAFARRPSEVWVFEGGAAPARTAKIRTGVGGKALALADIDRDGHRDLVALAEESQRVDVFFGDGDGHFARSSTLSVAGGAELATGDLTGDELPEVLVRAEAGLSQIGFGSSEALEATPLEVPEGFRRPRVIDLNGDGRMDLVGIREGEVTWLRRADEELAFHPFPLLTFDESGFVPMAAEIGDLDANGRLDAVVLGRSGEGGPWELVLVPDLGSGAVVEPSEEPRPIEDAPLTLQITP